jgi:hypothetical protein
LKKYQFTDIGDDEISEISFPKGIPFVYKFDKNLNTIKPEEANSSKLTQIHTNGIFLENPTLLEKALKTQKLWEERVPGSSEKDLPNIAERVTTLEGALLRLKEEKESWAGGQNGIGTNGDEKSLLGDVNDNGVNNGINNNVDIDNDVEERFEEDLDTSRPDGITVNWSSVDNLNDPIVVFVRHGRTPHNKLKLFTGWEDPPLAIEGVEDARTAGRLLKQHGFHFDVVYSSWLYRAIQTAWFILEEMDLLWLPVILSWRLNERH